MNKPNKVLHFLFLLLIGCCIAPPKSEEDVLILQQPITRVVLVVGYPHHYIEKDIEIVYNSLQKVQLQDFTIIISNEFASLQKQYPKAEFLLYDNVKKLKIQLKESIEKVPQQPYLLYIISHAEPGPLRTPYIPIKEESLSSCDIAESIFLSKKRLTSGSIVVDSCYGGDFIDKLGSPFHVVGTATLFEKTLATSNGSTFTKNFFISLVNKLNQEKIFMEELLESATKASQWYHRFYQKNINIWFPEVHPQTWVGEKVTKKLYFQKKY